METYQGMIFETHLWKKSQFLSVWKNSIEKDIGIYIISLNICKMKNKSTISELEV